MSSGLRLKDRHRTAYALLAVVVGRPEPDDPPFTRSWVYRWGLLFAFSLTGVRSRPPPPKAGRGTMPGRRK
ncbi:hypothetical protein [Streptomyces sp. NPDC058335]|uniref:hypothetical protein n=1 Tax=Streptomyces sp. NPDC058335 TaxID=3346451 RepID=UPI003647CF50